MTRDTAKTRELTKGQKAEYRENGFFVLRGVFGREEVEAFRREADDLAQRRDLILPDNLRTEHAVVDGTLMVNKYDPVVDVSPLFARVASDDRITEPAGALLGEAALAFKDKLIFKMPGHGGFGPHQDNTWWRAFPKNLITATVCIDAADRENGALELARGWHTLPNPVPEGELRDLARDECPPEEDWVLADSEAGDVIFFGCMTPHRSAVNRSDRPRRVLHLTYGPQSSGSLYAAHYEHLRAYMLGEQAESTGNFYVQPEYRATADFHPPLRPQSSIGQHGGGVLERNGRCL